MIHEWQSSHKTNNHVVNFTWQKQLLIGLGLNNKKNKKNNEKKQQNNEKSKIGKTKFP